MCQSPGATRTLLQASGNLSSHNLGDRSPGCAQGWSLPRLGLRRAQDWRGHGYKGPGDSVTDRPGSWAVREGVLHGATPPVTGCASPEPSGATAAKPLTASPRTAMASRSCLSVSLMLPSTFQLWSRFQRRVAPHHHHAL